MASNHARLRLSSRSCRPTQLETQCFEDMVRRLALRRKSLNVTQQQLSEELGVADGLVAKWESFAVVPSAFMLCCWCRSLGVTLVPLGLEEYA